MSKLILRPITTPTEKEIFTEEVQNAFQTAYEAEIGSLAEPILPTEDVEESFSAEGAQAYVAEANGKRVGGAIVAINEKTKFHSLHLLYVAPDAQNKGYGFEIWNAIEKSFPDTKVWETHTPYYDKRNIHFYVNRCGFKIVEFFCPKHPDPHQTGDTTGNIPAEQNLFFRFEKEMKNNK